MCCLETSHVHKATFAHHGNLVLLFGCLGFCWVGFFQRIAVIKSVIAPQQLLCSMCPCFQNLILSALLQQKASLEKTLLRALGLSFLYIGLVPFFNLKKPAFV